MRVAECRKNPCLTVKGKKKISDEKINNGSTQITFNHNNKPQILSIRAYNDSACYKYDFLDISIDKIESNKIKVYLSEGISFQEKLVIFYIKNENNKIIMRGPMLFIKNQKLKRDIFKFKSIVFKTWPWNYHRFKIINCCSNELTKLYSQ